MNKLINKLEIWICAVAKMEELYIREWIIWNKKIGITHIIIGDNNDSNYHIPLQPIIQDFIDEGYVELINKNDIKRVQNAFYKEIYQLRKREFDFIGFIDIDEFIELPAYENNINNFLSDSKFVNYDAIIIPWLNYGDNDQLYYENKPLKERFIKPILKDQSGIKYFIKSLPNVLYLISFHNPLLAKTINQYSIKVCDSLGDENFLKVKKNNQNDKFTQIYVKNKNYYNNAYISHYITKSTEEYIKYKVLRGRADQYDQNIKTLRYSKNFYFAKNIKTKEKLNIFNKYLNLIESKYNGYK